MNRVGGLIFNLPVQHLNYLFGGGYPLPIRLTQKVLFKANINTFEFIENYFLKRFF